MLSVVITCCGFDQLSLSIIKMRNFGPLDQVNIKQFYLFLLKLGRDIKKSKKKSDFSNPCITQEHMMGWWGVQTSRVAL